MRRKTYNQLSDDEPQFEISSLVDVSFLLLIYFLIVSTIQPQEKDLPMTLPSNIQGNFIELKHIFMLEVKDDGSIVMNTEGSDELLDLGNSGRDISNTKERLNLLSSLARSSGNELIIQLKVAPEAKHQRFIDVLNCLRGENINTITLAKAEKLF